MTRINFVLIYYPRHGSFVARKMEEFKKACGLPDIMVNRVAAFIYISSAISKDWHSLYLDTFGKSRRPLPTKAIDEYWSKDGMQITDWDAFETLIDATDFTKLSITALRGSSEDMNHFIDLMGPAFDKTRYDIQGVIKAYLVVHQKRALFLLAKILNKRLDYDTKTQLKEYHRGTPKPDYDTLKLILSYVK